MTDQCGKHRNMSRYIIHTKDIHLVYGHLDKGSWLQPTRLERVILYEFESLSAYHLLSHRPTLGRYHVQVKI